MANQPASVAEYLSSLAPDRRAALQAVRKVILDNLDQDLEEGVQYGMIGYYVPHRVYPDGYHCDPEQPLPFASIASQKNHMALYLFCIYTDPGDAERFTEDWKASGKKLDMGKACVRFKKLEDVPLEVVGKAIRRATAKRFIAGYEATRAANPKRATKSAAKPTTKKASKKATKKATKKSSKRAGKR